MARVLLIQRSFQDRRTSASYRPGAGSGYEIKVTLTTGVSAQSVFRINGRNLEMVEHQHTMD